MLKSLGIRFVCLSLSWACISIKLMYAFDRVIFERSAVMFACNLISLNLYPNSQKPSLPSKNHGYAPVKGIYLLSKP